MRRAPARPPVVDHMNIKEITKLAELMESKGLTRVEITEEGSSIQMERQVQVQVQAAPSAALPAVLPAAPQITGAPASELQVETDGAKEIKSPTVGVFYSSASPETEPFVQRGSVVKKGDVLCIIEAMKLMNEITSDVDGEVVDICIGNGQVVEYGQVLFRIR